MIAYRYNQKTGEYLGARKRQFHVGQYLMPGSCIETAPPEDIPEGKIAVVNEQKDGWNLIEDHRGKDFYNKATGEIERIEMPGPLPSVLTEKKPSSDFDEWDEKKKAWILNEQKKAEFEETAREAAVRAAIRPLIEDVLLGAKTLAEAQAEAQAIEAASKGKK